MLLFPTQLFQQDSTLRIKKIQLCLLALGFSAISAAQAHPALVIEALQAFESDTDAMIYDVQTDIDEINRLTQQYPAIANSLVLSDDLISSTREQTEQAVTLDNVVIKEDTQIETNKQTAENSTDSLASATVNQSTETIIASDVWDRIRAGFALETIHHPKVASYERQYVRNPKFLASLTQNAQKYLYHVTNAVEQYNMPAEIALLPVVESHFKPNAVSRSRAVGLWQIMPATGKHLGLRQNWWIDERKDVTAATNAALGYLNSLYERFGQWELALAAYNAGGGTVSRAIKRNRAANLSTRYLDLKLPKETRQYLPKLQAIKNIISAPEKYGVVIDAIADAPYFTAVSTPAQIDKTLIAELAGISIEEFEALNPQFKRPLITAQHSGQLLLPTQAADTFTAQLSFYDQPLVSWQSYTMPAGERLTKVAKQFGMSAKTLGKINQVSTHRRARRPIKLLVPNSSVVRSREQAQMADVVASSDVVALQQARNLSSNAIQALTKNTKRYYRPIKKRQKTYLVKRGDTLSEIAERYKLSLKKLQRMNHLKNRMLKAGQRIKLY